MKRLRELERQYGIAEAARNRARVVAAEARKAEREADEVATAAYHAVRHELARRCDKAVEREMGQ